MAKSTEMFKQDWAKALRSGMYGQTDSGLKVQGDNSFCCLGVALDMVGAEWDEERDGDDATNENGDPLVGCFYGGDYWTPCDTATLPLPLTGRQKIGAVLLNDEYGYTFDVIAEWIDAGLPPAREWADARGLETTKGEVN